MTNVIVAGRSFDCTVACHQKIKKSWLNPVPTRLCHVIYCCGDKFVCLFLTEEAWNHGGLRSRECSDKLSLLSWNKVKRTSIPFKVWVTFIFSIMIHDGGLSYEISKDFKIPLRSLLQQSCFTARSTRCYTIAYMSDKILSLFSNSSDHWIDPDIKRASLCRAPIWTMASIYNKNLKM